VRWSDARDGAGATADVIDRLGAFLVLVGLSGLAVGGVGVSAAVAAYLTTKTSVIATLRSLGASRATIFGTYFVQVGVLALAGVAAGIVLGVALPILAAPLIERALPVPAAFGLYPRPLLEAATYGVLSAALFTLWPLARAGDVRAATLFRDALAGGRRLPRLPYLVAVALLLAALLLAASLFSEAPSLTLWTAGAIAAALLVLAVAAALARALARRFAPWARGRPAWRLALGAVGAQGGETVPVVLSLGLGLSVLAAVGQIDGNLRRAIQADLPSVAPRLLRARHPARPGRALPRPPRPPWHRPRRGRAHAARPPYGDRRRARRGGGRGPLGSSKATAASPTPMRSPRGRRSPQGSGGRPTMVARRSSASRPRRRPRSAWRSATP
jgi:putative ABC transport system permease protein